jgi:hypothetical protein
MLSVFLWIPPAINFWTPEQSLWNWVCTTYHDTWAHLNVVLRKSLPSVCVSMCIPPIVARQRLSKSVSLLSLLGNGSVNTFPWQRIHPTIEELLDACVRGSLCITLSLLGNSAVKAFPRQRRIVGEVVFYAVRAVWTESRRLIIPRTFCLIPFHVYTFHFSLPSTRILSFFSVFPTWFVNPT